MFENLGDRLQGAIQSLRGRGRLSEADVKAALREVRVALLEADVALEVARDFVKRVEAEAIGDETLMSLTPDQRVIRIVRDELQTLLGGESVQPELRSDGNVWLMMGLQGAGKTTTVGKLAYHFKAKGRRPLLVAADTQRPAARDQLEVLADRVGVPVLKVADGEPPETTKARIDAALREDFRDLVLVDTAGRLEIDEALMGELAALDAAVGPTERLLVVDAMTGQQTLPVARTFDERVGVSGLVLSKMDGDARGGAALSATHVTGRPIYYAGTSEKLDGLEAFHPERIAGRILGMGDVLTLIEKAEALEDAAEDGGTGGRPQDFSLQDMLHQMRQLKKMGSFGEILGMIPGAKKMMPAGADVDEGELARVEAILSSMTDAERRTPRVLDASRRRRIARGSGTTVQDVNRLMKNYEATKKMMKKAGKTGRLPAGFGG
ncbi:MAG: signal recognition particle protein [Trueperaceae bacterium]|nr:signal recognition particle protein [Trueperaceae bacterium]